MNTQPQDELSTPRRSAARRWFSQAAGMIGQAIRRKTVENPDTPVEAPIPESRPPAPAPAPVSDDLTWQGAFFRVLPLSMLIVGLALSACAQLIGVWVMLGFLLIVAAPIVHWLRRIDQRLVELIKTIRSGQRR